MGFIFNLTLCLITLFSLASCASSSREVAQVSEVKRSPDFPLRSEFANKFNKQTLRDKN